MSKENINHSVTIGYRAVITVDVKAETQEEAKKKALEIFNKERKKLFMKNNITLEADTYNAYGVVNMDEPWNML